MKREHLVFGDSNFIDPGAGIPNDDFYDDVWEIFMQRPSDMNTKEAD
jgi:hypothetical protein